MDRKWRIEQIGAPNGSSAALATLYRINWPNSWSVGAAMLEEMSKLRAVKKENSSRSVHDKNNPLTNI